MAHLATTRAGVAEFLAGGAKGHLWIGNNVLSDEEVRILRRQGSSITMFTSQVKTLAEIEGAVPILREHHPNEAIWIEHLPEGANPKSSDVAQRSFGRNRSSELSSRMMHSSGSWEVKSRAKPAPWSRSLRSLPSRSTW
jgi:hypothetical protein